jgi:hypothetical protein
LSPERNIERLEMLKMMVIAVAVVFGHSTPANAWEGLYRGAWDYGQVTVIIEASPEFRGQPRFRVSLRVRRTGCVGEVDGIGFATGDNIFFRSENSGGQFCTVVLNRKNQNLTIQTLENCSGYSGATCGFGGTVQKR